MANPAPAEFDGAPAKTLHPNTSIWFDADSDYCAKESGSCLLPSYGRWPC